MQQVPDVNELRGFLANSLPEYMIPSTFMTLETLPLAPNGKINHRALPAPDFTRPELENPFVQPQTLIQKKLAKIWVEVLGIDRVGINDSFLELGGNSLLATQIISRVITDFRVVLPLRLLFETPTVADMAKVILENLVRETAKAEIDRELEEIERLSEAEAESRLRDKVI